MPQSIRDVNSYSFSVVQHFALKEDFRHTSLIDRVLEINSWILSTLKTKILRKKYKKNISIGEGYNWFVSFARIGKGMSFQSIQ